MNDGTLVISKCIFFSNTFLSKKERQSLVWYFVDYRTSKDKFIIQSKRVCLCLKCRKLGDFLFLWLILTFYYLRPFKCEFCGTRYYRKNVLKAHLAKCAPRSGNMIASILSLDKIISTENHETPTRIPAQPTFVTIKNPQSKPVTITDPLKPTLPVPEAFFGQINRLELNQQWPGKNVPPSAQVSTSITSADIECKQLFIKAPTAIPALINSALNKNVFFRQDGFNLPIPNELH